MQAPMWETASLMQLLCNGGVTPRPSMVPGWGGDHQGSHHCLLSPLCHKPCHHPTAWHCSHILEES